MGSSGINAVPSQAGTVDSSSAAMPIWMWVLLGLTLFVCVALLVALAAAPFLFKGKKKTTSVSAICDDDEEMDDQEHANAYRDLGAIPGESNLGQSPLDMMPFLSQGPSVPVHLPPPTTTSMRPPTTTALMAPATRAPSASQLLVMSPSRTPSGQMSPRSNTFVSYPGGYGSRY